ncbi:MAG: PEP-CTERM sorting domain-containing protein [Desulfopila sp.]
MMTKRQRLTMVLTMVFFTLVTAASALALPIYQVGSTTELFRDGNYYALSSFGLPVPGSQVINVPILADFSGEAELSITAEGVDSPFPGGIGENDQVFFGVADTTRRAPVNGSGSFLGLLNQQGFFAPTLFLNLGPGAMADGSTALTTTIFDVWVTAGVDYFLTILIDAPNWVSEIETVSLQPKSTVNPIPEPATAILLVSGLAGLVAYRRRKRS